MTSLFFYINIHFDTKIVNYKINSLKTYFGDYFKFRNVLETMSYVMI